jgi:hypothetical protein
MGGDHFPIPYTIYVLVWNRDVTKHIKYVVRKEVTLQQARRDELKSFKVLRVILP